MRLFFIYTIFFLLLLANFPNNTTIGYVVPKNDTEIVMKNAKQLKRDTNKLSLIERIKKQIST
jgi:hypothetical protein